MKREALYHADTNELEELPQMEKREHPKGSDFHEWAEYVKYTIHVTTLRRLPCSPECKGVWADQQKVVEGKDYVVKTDLVPPYDWQVGPETVQTAYPIAPVKSEDEKQMWMDAIQFVIGEMAKDPFTPNAWYEAVKQKYSLTKR